MEENIKDTTMAKAALIHDAFTESSLLPRYSSYSMVSRFKSVRRAIRRGHIDLFFGIVLPKRPFNNRKPTPGRAHNELKKAAYERFRVQQ
jgi:hypothetical protein